MKFALRSLAIGWLAVLFLLGSYLWWTAYDRTFVALPYNDSLDYASIALNIANGKGILSSYLTPLSLAHVDAPYPNIWRAPLWPLVLAGSYLLSEPADWVVAAASGLFYLLTIVPLFLLAWRMVSLEVAIGTVVIYLFSPQVLHFSLSGMTEPIATFFLVTWFYLLYRLGEKRADMPDLAMALHLVLVGALAGLFYLTRYNALLFLPLTVGYLWLLLAERAGLKRRKRKGEGQGLLSGAKEGRQVYRLLAIYLLAWLVAVSPWLMRNMVLAGNPLFSLQSYEPAMFTATYPDYTLYMLPETIDVKQFVLGNREEMVDKFLAGVEEFKADFFDPKFSGVHPWLVGLALISLAVPQRRDQFLFKLLVAGSYLIQLFSLLVIHYIPRLFIIFTPFLILFALMTVWQVLSLFHRRPVAGGRQANGRQTARQALALGLLTVAVGLAVWYNPYKWDGRNSWYNWPVKFGEAIRDSRELFLPGDVIVSNDGHILAWYADRTAIKLPVHPDQLANLMERAPIKGIFLTDLLLRPYTNTPEADLAWDWYLRERPEMIGEFKLVKVYENGSLLYVHQDYLQ